jgi:hypothetical protein
MARIVFRYVGGETLSFDIDHTNALGVRIAGTRSRDHIDHWVAAERLKSVVLVHDQGADEITAPEHVDGVSASRETF